MICFCEDCGEKNHIETGQIKNGGAEFRCKACHYRNAYPIPEPAARPDRLFELAGHHPDIAGAFIFPKTGLPIAGHIPDQLIQADLETMGHCLVSSFRAALDLYPDIQEQVVTIGDKYITAQRIGPDRFVLVISTVLPLPRAIQDQLAALNGKELPHACP